MSAGEIGTVAGSFFTAIAAIAAWRSARHSKQGLERASIPILHAQAIRNPADGTLLVSVVNGGGGVAHGSMIAIRALRQHADNLLLDGVVAPGAHFHVYTSIGPIPTPESRTLKSDLPDLAVMVSYRDARGFVHYRSNTENEWVPKTRILRRPQFPDRTDAFKRLFPDIDIDDAEVAACWPEPPRDLVPAANSQDA